MTLQEMIDEEKREGFEEGLAEGREDGKAEEKKTIARNFKTAGIPLDVVAQNTGLSLADVEAL